jgi:hypothetical protein
MFNRAYLTLPLIAVAFSIASAAQADVAPPETYVETCKVDKQETATTECVSCKSSRGTDIGENSRCSKLLSTYCYTNNCKTWGASAWTEVWCRAKNSTAPALPNSVTSQMAVYDEPNLDGVAGAANCTGSTTPATGGASSIPTATGGKSSVPTATGGKSSVPTATGGKSSTPTATGGASAISSSSTEVTPGDPESDSGCSLSHSASGAGTASLGLLGLLGLMLVMKRKNG